MLRAEPHEDDRPVLGDCPKQRLLRLLGTMPLSSIGWTYARQGAATTAQTSRAMDVITYTQDANGQLRVARLMWSALP